MAQTSDNSAPFKAGAFGASGGGLVILGYYFHRNLQVLLILAIGFVVVILLLLAYLWFLKRRQVAQSAKMGLSLEESARPKPRGINTPEALARLADLQTKFEAGVAKFKAAGKDLYALPWYLLVGEPGGGKSEAIRHCNVGFPPGLQEEQQGVGGTINMNWWFTNHAIILDTAGRLMFDQVEAGATGEWKEFLKLLLKARPKCPINGMLLVIPAESLIVDSPEKINEKASKIARQLGTIQQELGVRFPVFVVISKSDKINGFREFFDAQSDPRLQHQMMGWSNPQPLDAPFNPEMVTEHLASISNRLVRRRLGLLLDPIHTDDPNARRIDQVDALYAFPESLATIGPGLKQYLELIFTVGEWSPKPLFLRGIYFTSSMREGSALDKDLAELLGVPVESLPEGRVWEKDRAFFLRDLFMTKVFREKGLVTQANNARGLQRRRKITVLAGGFAAVFILAALTIFQYQQLQRNVGDKLNYWQNLQLNYGGGSVPYDHMCLLTNQTGSSSGIFATTRPTEFAYHGQDYFQLDNQTRGKTAKLGMFFTEAQRDVVAPIKVPAAFFWVPLLPDKVTDEQRKAYYLLFENTVIRPVVAAVRAKLFAGVPLDSADSATAGRTFDVVHELLQLEALKAGSVRSNATLDLGKLYRYVLSSDDWAKFDADAPPDSSGAVVKSDHYRLQKICEEICTQAASSGADSAWPFSNVDAGTYRSVAPIETGVNRLVEYWKDQVGDGSAARVTVRLRKSLMDFQAIEAAISQDLSAYQPAGPATMEQFADIRTKLDPQLARLKADKLEVDRLLAGMKTDPLKWPPAASLMTLYTSDREAAAKSQRSQIDELIGTYPSEPTALGIKRIITALRNEESSTKTTEIPPDVVSSIEALDKEYFTAAGSVAGAVPGKERPYEKIARAYDAASAMLMRDPATERQSDRPADRLFRVGDLFANPEKAGESAINAAVSTLPDSSFPARENCGFIIQKLAVPRDQYVAVDRLISDLALQSKDAVAMMVSTDAAARPVFQLQPLMPMTVPPAPPVDAGNYAPESASKVLGSWSELGRPLGVVPSTQPTAISLGKADLQSKYNAAEVAVRGYTGDYISYWRNGLNQHFSSMTIPKWGPDLSNALPLPAAANETAKKLLATAADKILEPLLQVNSVDTDAEKFIDDFTARRSVPADPKPTDPKPADLAPLAKWRQLAQDKTLPAEARQEIRKLQGYPGFANACLSTGDTTYLDLYWSSVTRACLKSLASAVTDSARDCEDDLKKNYAALPLVLPDPNGGRQSLTNAEMKVALAKLSLWTTDAGETPNPNLPADSPESDYQKVIHLHKPGAGLGQMLDLAKYFYVVDGTVKVNCTVSSVELGKQQEIAAPGTLANGICDTVSVKQNNAALEEAAAFPEQSTAAKTFGVIVLFGDPKHDSLEVVPAMQHAELASVPISGAWSCFQKMLGPGVKHDQGSNAWIVPVEVQNGKFLYLKFELNLPRKK